MRAGGAMALLMAQVDTDMIRLVGRWRSDIILRLLHTTAHMFAEGIAERMVQHGDYALIPPAHWGLKTPLPDSGPLLGPLWVTMGGLA